MKIFIWGTGKLATNYMQLEFFKEHEILGFIESDPKNKMFMNRRIFRPEEITGIDYDYIVVCVAKDNSAIIRTCITNEIGLNKVILVSGEKKFTDIPDDITKQLVNLGEISDCFPVLVDRIMERQALKGAYLLYNEINFLKAQLKDQALICDLDDNQTIAWVPIELLFLQKQEDNLHIEFTEEWKAHNSMFEDRPIISILPFRSLFSFFMNGTDYPNDYCEWRSKIYTTRGVLPPYTDEQLIGKRFNEFRHMSCELNKGMDFFIKNPATAKWNKKGYFNLLDGHHRTYFLYASGLTKIPIQMQKEDYDVWCNREAVKGLHQVILKQRRTEYYQPILNPFFLNLLSYREDFVKSRLHHIMEYFGSTRLVGKRIIDIGANMGYMGQAFYRMIKDGSITQLEPDPLHYELLCKVNALVYTEAETIETKFEEYIPDQPYDIALCLTVFYHYFGNEDVRGKFIQHLDKYVTSMIIWESGGAVEEEKNYILEHTKFKHYEHICYTYATGKFRELGVFKVDEPRDYEQ